MLWKWSKRVAGWPVRVEKAASNTTSTLLLLKTKQKKKQMGQSEGLREANKPWKERGWGHGDGKEIQEAIWSLLLCWNVAMATRATDVGSRAPRVTLSRARPRAHTHSTCREVLVITWYPGWAISGGLIGDMCGIVRRLCVYHAYNFSSGSLL